MGSVLAIISSTGEYSVSSQTTRTILVTWVSLFGRKPGQRSEVSLFRIEEQRRPRMDIDITWHLIDKMCKGAPSIFDLGRIVYRISNKNTELAISMVFWDVEDKKGRHHPYKWIPDADRR
ncbi:hypothetical protein F4680DRAFT_306671 [Xylaria scruposa]|nr:hypothetical protein F4680DRAFT_306671 [Xylaria scruposa]